MFDFGIVAAGAADTDPLADSIDRNTVIFRCGCERSYFPTWTVHRFNPTKMRLCFDHTKLYERYLCDLAGVKPPPLTPLHRHTAMDR